MNDPKAKTNDSLSRFVMPDGTNLVKPQFNKIIKLI